jgi:hypothetical protein
MKRRGMANRFVVYYALAALPWIRMVPTENVWHAKRMAIQRCMLQAILL